MDTYSAQTNITTRNIWIFRKQIIDSDTMTKKWIILDRELTERKN